MTLLPFNALLPPPGIHCQGGGSFRLRCFVVKLVLLSQRHRKCER